MLIMSTGLSCIPKPRDRRVVRFEFVLRGKCFLGVDNSNERALVEKFSGRALFISKTTDRQPRSLVEYR